MRLQNLLWYKHGTLLKFALSFFGQSVLQTSETVVYAVNRLWGYTRVLQHIVFFDSSTHDLYKRRPCTFGQSLWYTKNSLFLVDQKKILVDQEKNWSVSETEQFSQSLNFFCHVFFENFSPLISIKM